MTTTAAEAARYAELRSRISAMLTVPSRFNFVADTFEKWSSDRLCMRWIDDSGSDRAISWKEMADAASRVVNVLRSNGVKKGDRVFIQVGRLPEWWETMLACLKMGAVAMPGTVMLTPKDIGYRLELSEPAAVVTEASIAPRFAEARAKAGSVKAYLAVGGRPDGWLDFRAERDRAAADAPAEPTLATDPALLYFTSGTTGYREDGAPHAGLLRDRSRRDRQLLARPRAGGPALEHLRHRLGESRVELLLRPVHSRARRSSSTTRPARSAASGCSTSSRSTRSRACAAPPTIFRAARAGGPPEVDLPAPPELRRGRASRSTPR